MPVATRLILLVIAAMVLLTLADLAISMHVLQGGAVELNPYARNGTGNIRTGWLLAANVSIMTPLAIAFIVAMRHAGRVPADVLDHWWRHLFNFFTARPGSRAARERAPLRLAAAALTIIIFKFLIVGSNVLVGWGVPNPASFVADRWSDFGLEGAAHWRATYAVLVLPCYIVAVWLAAVTLRTVHRADPSIIEDPPA